MCGVKQECMYPIYKLRISHQSAQQTGNFPLENSIFPVDLRSHILLTKLYIISVLCPSFYYTDQCLFFCWYHTLFFFPLKDEGQEEFVDFFLLTYVNGPRQHRPCYTNNLLYRS